MITHVLAAVLAAGAWAGDWEKTAELARRELSESAGRREEAVARSCAKIVTEEKARYRELEAAALTEASMRTDGLLDLLNRFRRTFTTGDWKILKEANAERKRLYEAGHASDPDGPDLFDHWEGKMKAVIEHRYRSFAVPRRTVSDERSQAEIVTALAWHLGRPGDSPRSTAYAVACVGGYERWWGNNSRDWRELIRHPVCVTMDLLDGSLPPGPAPEKYLRGPAVREAAAQPGWVLALFPEEADYLKGRLTEIGAKECR